jgi:hypothetical protein
MDVDIRIEGGKMQLGGGHAGAVEESAPGILGH